MLHKDPFIISPQTFRLIQELQSLPELKEFFLVGGTSLALQLGHRNSIDIDLFGQHDFSDDDILSLLNSKFEVKEIYRRKNTIISLVDNIKTDFIKHAYPLILPPITEDGITFLSKEDITAMKFHAIIQSGKRLKDFIDIYYLLQHFNMEQMIGFFTQKYSYSNPMIAMKAVNYFDEIDENIDPPKLLVPVTIKQIKARIQEATQKPSKIF
jgi:Nucleotidyl transferase AbiEii toxin, Type IV TA system